MRNLKVSLLKFSISVDQSFHVGLTLDNNLVVYLFMNFKKGSKITKDKIEIENDKSCKLLKILPTNIL